MMFKRFICNVCVLRKQCFLGVQETGEPIVIIISQEGKRKSERRAVLRALPWESIRFKILMQGGMSKPHFWFITSEQLLFQNAD